MVAQWIRDEIREVSPGVYLGKVYWSDKRLIDLRSSFQSKFRTCLQNLHRKA